MPYLNISTRPEMLHITRGLSTGGSLKRPLSGGSHAILASTDALDDGPVPAGLSLRQLSRVRAAHWVDSNRPGWRARSREIEAEFLEYERALRRFRDFREVVLWRGSTVGCQLFLIQMLAWFAEQDMGDCKVCFT